jgi:hypothetical protein
MAKVADGVRQKVAAVEAPANSQARRLIVWECRTSPTDTVGTGGVRGTKAIEEVTKRSGSRY